MKKAITLLLSVSVLFSLCACSDTTDTSPATDAAGTTDTTDTADIGSTKEADWAVYWYLCGSDLESGGGFATTDLQELTSVGLPDNVKVVIQTGGSSQWHNDTVDASKLQRYVYDSTGLNLVDEQPSASMGEQKTLSDFLSYAKENYPAQKTAVVFWNHGGGSVSGAAFDELYGNDSLTLDELHAAFASVWDLSHENQPLELIGFDTCLMATVDVAGTFSDIGKYLVASEEVEPGNGWLYSGWMKALADNPGINGEDLGKAICDSFYAGCEKAGTADNVTLSVTDLSAAGDLFTAYEAFGAEALSAACSDPVFFSSFGRAACASENYGGNTKEQGYTNMVDLGHLARLAADILPQSSDAVLSALNKCIVYKINGQYRSESTGLSCYYSYSADIEDFSGYEKIGEGQAFKHYFSYGLTGQLDEDGMNYIKNLQFDTLPELVTLKTKGWDGIRPEIDGDGNAVMSLGAEAADVLSSIGFQLYYAVPESDTMFLLGTDNDMAADWSTGVFKDNFRKKWGAIDGNPVYMELYYECGEYNLYSVPVLLNNEAYNLMVAYTSKNDTWTIQGARKSLDDSGMADKNLRQLTPGDEITALHYATPISDDSEELEEVQAATFTFTENTSFAETELDDGMYIMIFEMHDAHGNSAYSEPVVFECANGEISTYIPE